MMADLPNESQYIRILLLLADTQAWMNELGQELLHTLCPSSKKLFSSKTYRLSLTAFAHIIERHYYKTMRHPGTGKFMIPISTILDYIREAASAASIPMKGYNNCKKTVHFPEPIGINKYGEPASSLIVIVDPHENIITAYPE